MKLGVTRQGLSTEELHEAERGFLLLLRRKRFSQTWIENNARDILGQAHQEYATKLAAGEAASNRVGWIINCAWRRTQDTLRNNSGAPSAVSTEQAVWLADETTPTPEQQVLDNERTERLRAAIERLPGKDQELMALVYFGGLTVREAGRKLGWQKSPADRHHRLSIERLQAMFDDPNALSPASLGLAAWAAVTESNRRPWSGGLEFGREVAASASEALSHLSHRAVEVWRRLAPFGEPGNAAALGGGARVAGYCGAAASAVVCGLAATGVVSPGLPAGNSEPPVVEKRAPSPRPPVRLPTAREAKPPPTLERVTKRTRPEPRAPEQPAAVSSGAPSPEPESVSPSSAPLASSSQTESEFGFESGSTQANETTPEPESSEGGSSSPPASPAPTPTRPQSGSRGAAAAEFGL